MTRGADAKRTFPLKFPRREPRVQLCRACSRKIVQEPKSFIAIRGGGLVRLDEVSDVWGPSSAALGHLNLYWYSDCSRDPEPRVPKSTLLQVVAHAEDGQYEIRVCSLACLRRFFRAIESELRVAIAETKAQPKARRRRPKA
jgi:hypothetical protein